MFQSLIVLLYVLDNDTNTLVRISIGVGLLIELWKIKKVVDIKVDYERRIFGLLPRITFEDKGSYANSPTKEYDAVSERIANRFILLFNGQYSYCNKKLISLSFRSWLSSTFPGSCFLCWSATASTR